MSGSLGRRLLAPIVQIRNGESATAVLMFAYSFLAMTAYNIIKPATRSSLIKDLGAENLPYVQLAAGVLIGVLMQLYTRGVAWLPRRSVIPVTQAGLVGVLLGFWALFQTGQSWVSTGFYLLGLIMGILVISQFWTLANDIYDARQAKRLFGFIGGGSVLGGATGAGVTTLVVERVGTTNLLLVSAAILTMCLLLVIAIVKREEGTGRSVPTADEEGVGGKEALRLLRHSTHLQIIALVIGFAAIGAGIIEQQLNMAAQQIKGQGSTDAITGFLAQVTLYLSLIGFLIQVGLTSRIHRLLGLGFALLVLPTSLGATGMIMLFNAALWAPALARIVDTSLRYTLDKTTREVLFLPLPVDLKYKAKPFVDVTVDRFAKGLGAVLALVLIKPWGLNFTWQQLSYASLAVAFLWVFIALRARREYLAAFRRSIEQRDMQPAEVRLNVADLTTVETLVEELANPDERRVIYAIDLLESFDKRNLITPLLLHHESPDVRARALQTLAAGRPDTAVRSIPAIERMLKDQSAHVRASAVRALAALRGEAAADLMRPYLDDPDARVAVTAAAALAAGARGDEVAAAEATLKRLSADTRESAAAARKVVAQAIAEIRDPRFRDILVPLMYDPAVEVAQEAIRSAGRLGAGDYLFVPPLVSLLRNRRLKALAREVLVGYGEGVLDALAYFLSDREEDVWVRRHIPATLALIPTKRSVDLLIEALSDPDGFLRYKAVAALEKLRREHAELTIPPEAVQSLTLAEAGRYFNCLTLHYNLFHHGGFDRTSLLARALEEKLRRTLDRVYRLLALIYPWKDVGAVRWAIEHGDARGRSGAVEYLDNLLTGAVRRRVMLTLEEMPLDEKVRKANVVMKTRARDAEDTLAQLVHDEDQVVAAVAIHEVEARQLWKLADDLEHALAHRDPKDWYVFEAASWALAASRMPAERRRALWAEPLPAVELVNRLRRLPLFDFVSVDELFRIAGLGRQVRFEAGRTLYETGSTPGELQFLLDGRVEVRAHAGAATGLEPPASIAFEEVIEGAPMPAEARAATPAICLSLRSEELLALLSENIELAQGLFRMLLERGAAIGWRQVVKGRLTPEIERLVARGGLQPIEKILLLQHSPLLARATAGELVDLAAIAREMPLTGGEALFGSGDAPAIYAILAGQVVLEHPDRADPIAAGAGDTIGIYETLAGVNPDRRATVTAAGLALRIDRQALFDLLADHIDLLQGLFSALLHARQGETVAAS